MKKLITFIALFLTTTSISAQEISDSILGQYFDKSKKSWKIAEENPTQKNWLTALKDMFVYRELAAINKTDKARLDQLDNNIETAQNKVLAISPKDSMSPDIAKTVERLKKSGVIQGVTIERQ
jgi:hypothetical protein